jgi:hypothetical protein
VECRTDYRLRISVQRSGRDHRCELGRQSCLPRSRVAGESCDFGDVAVCGIRTEFYRGSGSSLALREAEGRHSKDRDRTPAAELPGSAA